jgi:hypothetical protein
MLLKLPGKKQPDTPKVSLAEKVRRNRWLRQAIFQVAGTIGTG